MKWDWTYLEKIDVSRNKFKNMKEYECKNKVETEDKVMKDRGE